MSTIATTAAPAAPTATPTAPTAPARQLLPHHLDDLRRSGLSDATIAACGFHSECDHARINALLARKLPKRAAPCLVIPFLGPGGSNGYHRLRPDNPRRLKDKPVKYESPAGRPNEVFTPPGTFEAIKTPGAEIGVTEGEKKAAKADQEGFPCLGLVGVYGWKTAKAERLLPALEAIDWRNRPVWIGFDSDIDKNENVQDAEARLAAQLASRGAMVKCLRMPDLPGGSKCGVDDFLVHRDIGEFRKLLDEAVEPGPVDAAVAKMPAGDLDPATEADEFLRRTSGGDGVRRLRFWRGGLLHWMGGRTAKNHNPR
ncbi:MAG: DUF3854 domain-containing protein [Pirellulales bacterium]|nr:DUF3854 domain-containing protein [Pirellulales bacterium]